MELGSAVRQLCPCGDIVIVTAYDHCRSLTFEYAIEAMDYIQKDSTEEVLQKIRECVEKSYRRLHIERDNHQKHFKVAIGSRIRQLDLKDIIFFETTARKNKVRVYYKDEVINFRDSLKNIESFDDQLCRLHESFLVNISHIREIKSKQCLVRMSNNIDIPVSLRKRRLVKKLIEKNIINV
ncbi:DNA-binding response regulator [Dolosicoccus paucivorans]|uniref:DNA-binding response regulator n=1 Tax=Dolosicoccus paucivorans TaxID=84521 RepID=A0A2N6SMQ3_9LACT|nr:DNA-binding response regulator [Dolosicoccus paucivorans]PMC58330.1 DNA-binding response regulator [Dolosicoccus paucivorans]